MRSMRRAFWVAAIMLVATACGSGDATETTTTTTVVFTSTSVPTTSSTTSTTLATTTTPTLPPLSATDTTYRVQLDLKALGLFSGQVDGIAGEETQAALRSFQTQQGISADGEFGPVTDGALYPLLMDNTAYVEDLQEKLKELGLYSGPIDGDYGKGTTAAVEKLQASCDLEQTGDIDIKTRLCLDAK